MRSRRSLALMLGGLLLTSLAQAIEIRKWERVPLAIPLVVGQERILFVDANVRVGVPPAIAEKLRVQSTGGAIYLRAKDPIEPSRLQLQNAATGEIMLVDIAATPALEGQAALEPIKIVPGDTTPTRYGQAAAPAPKSTAKASRQTEEDDDEPAPPKRETPIPVVLTRYAAQMLYAPLRTVEPVDGVAQVKVDKRLDLSTLLPALPVEVSQLGAWRLDDHWVTAVKLRNQTGQRLALDPRELMGDFATATFQHPYLGARGDASDTTVLYLVTRDHGLGQSLLPSLGAADPRVTAEARHAAQK
ncbi:TIGR03749 family integrating conjugative element protein [Pseudomonas sp. Snoq117.2]|uniref:TIGR03749 family integrating conjugative element protein n=1 Tax=Pseudomonas sp. Snoq117.2 TaxID=1500302 RepID=UPI00073617D0|nr:TIGR03749 family integrating conjugative element protein [Pseudomonas sp. Snoq117.2]KTT64122.1 conjugal transfer protein [Pseudomonas psychrotolerans]SEP29975.1 integrating conjugative element protein, PFL_4704 family [Pseudomonas sp. Snoq117.2]